MTKPPVPPEERYAPLFHQLQPLPVPPGEAAAIQCYGHNPGQPREFANLAAAADALQNPCPNRFCHGKHVVAWRSNGQVHAKHTPPPDPPPPLHVELEQLYPRADAEQRINLELKERRAELAREHKRQRELQRQRRDALFLTMWRTGYTAIAIAEHTHLSVSVVNRTLPGLRRQHPDADAEHDLHKGPLQRRQERKQRNALILDLYRSGLYVKAIAEQAGLSKSRTDGIITALRQQHPDLDEQRRQNRFMCLTPDERADRKRKIARDWVKNLPPDRRADHLERQRVRARNKWARLTPEQRWEKNQKARRKKKTQTEGALDVTQPDPLAAQRDAHGPVTPEEVSSGREALLDAWQGAQDAKAWALDRSLDPAVPLEDSPPAWADTSTTTVDDAAQTLDWLRD